MFSHYDAMSNPEIITQILQHLKPNEMSQVSSLSFFFKEVTEQHVWLSHFKKYFPEKFTLITRNDYKAVLTKIDKQYDWQRLFMEEFYRDTHSTFAPGIYRNEKFVQDVFEFKSLNLSFILELLKSPQDYARIFTRCENRYFFFDTLAKENSNSRQMILDRVFNEINLHHKEAFKENYLTLLSSFRKISIEFVTPTFVLASIFNQTNLINDFLSQQLITQTDAEYMCKISIRFNYEEQFELLNQHFAFSATLPNQVNSLLDCLHQVVKYFPDVDLFLSASFRNKLYALLKPIYTGQDLWNATADTHHIGLVHWAILLKQTEVLTNLHRLPHLALEEYFSYLMDIPQWSYFSQHIKNFLLSKEISLDTLPLLDQITGYHPFHYYIYANDLAGLNRVLVSTTNENVITHAAEISIRLGASYCFKLILQHPQVSNDIGVFEKMIGNSQLPVTVKKELEQVLRETVAENYRNHCTII